MPVRGLIMMVVLACIGGCALVTATPPTIEVVSVELSGLGPTEQFLAVSLCVANPNQSRLAFRRVTAALDVADAPLATGTTDLPVDLPPLSSTVVPFRVVTTVRNIGLQLLGIVQSRAVDYRVHGTVTLQGALGITLPFSHAGRLDPLASGTALSDVVPNGTSPQCVRGSPTQLPS